MIARNYRRFPEALLYQLELALGEVAETIQAIRVKGGAAWANLVHRYLHAAADVRGVVAVPAWLKAAMKRAKALALDVKNRCLDLAEEKHQVDLPAAIPNVFEVLDSKIRARGGVSGRDNYARPDLTGYRVSDIGRYQQFCHIGWQPFVGPFDYSFTYSAEGPYPPATGIAALEAMTERVLHSLCDAGIRELDDLAELTIDELAELVQISESDAYTILKQARAHWFH